MNVRTATVADVEAIQTVAERSWTEDYPHITSRETAVEGAHEWYATERVTDEIERPDAIVFVATKDGEIVGFSHGAWTATDGDVLRVYVDPDHRGEGIGTSLLDSTVDALFERDVNEVRAMVLAENEPGNEFYRARGFEPLDETYKTRILDEYYEERVWKLTR